MLDAIFQITFEPNHAFQICLAGMSLLLSISSTGECDIKSQIEAIGAPTAQEEKIMKIAPHVIYMI